MPGKVETENQVEIESQVQNLVLGYLQLKCPKAARALAKKLEKDPSEIDSEVTLEKMAVDDSSESSFSSSSDDSSGSSSDDSSSSSSDDSSSSSSYDSSSSSSDDSSDSSSDDDSDSESTSNDKSESTRVESPLTPSPPSKKKSKKNKGKVVEDKKPMVKAEDRNPIDKILPAANNDKNVGEKRKSADDVSQHNPKQPKRFSRVEPEKVTFMNEKLRDNTFMSKGGSEGSYGMKAHLDLIVTKGKGFTKEKNKKKRGSYRGGAIDFASHSIKFDDSD